MCIVLSLPYKLVKDASKRLILINLTHVTKLMSMLCLSKLYRKDTRLCKGDKEV